MQERTVRRRWGLAGALVLALLAGRQAAAADLVAAQTGNFTGSIWYTTDSTGTFVDTSNYEADLATSARDSASFVLGASQIQGVAVRVSRRGASASPTNTITVAIRNSTTATNACSVTVNVSDLPEISLGDWNGGWYFFKCGTPFTPNGTDSYVVRASVSGTSPIVHLARSNFGVGGSYNWQRILVRSTTTTPSAGDNLYVLGTLDGSTNPATPATVTVTMDSTASTDYGAATADTWRPGLHIGNRGVLTYGTTSATNYVLRVSAWIEVANGGALRIGTTGTPIPGDATAVLEFDCASDGQFGLIARSGAEVQVIGSPRTAGKLVSWTLLTADMAGGATSATIADDTGWKSGDVVWFASTSRTGSEAESVTLNGDAGASSLAWTGGTAAAHKGADGMQAEVVNVTRNVTVRSVTSTNATIAYLQAAANIDVAWARFQHHGYGNDNATPGFKITLTSGSLEMDHAVFLDCEGTALSLEGTLTGSIDIQDVAGVAVNTNATANESFVRVVASGAGLTMNNIISIHDGAGITAGLWVSGAITTGSFTNFRLTSAGGYGFYSNVNTDYRNVTLGPFVIHSNSESAMLVASATRNLTISGPTYAWRNTASSTLVGVNFTGSHHGLTVDRLRAWGNGTSNLGGVSGTALYNATFLDPQLSGDSTFATSYGLYFDGSGTFLALEDVRIEGGSLGAASGVLVAHATADLRFDLIEHMDLTFNNVILASGTEASFATVVSGNSIIRYQDRDQVAGQSSTWTPFGTVARETTTVDVSPSIKVTPSSAAQRLDTGSLWPGTGLRVPVASGGAVTVTVKVRTDGSYNGAAPRLVVRANPSVGYASDTVLDTHTASADTWETLSGTTSAAAADGWLEFVVDGTGTAGSFYVDTWTANGQPVGDGKWFNGQPHLTIGDGGGGGGYPRSRIQRF